MPSALSRHLRHHARFDASVVAGIAAFAAARLLHLPVPAAIGSDTFFAVFLAASAWLVHSQSARDLDRKADVEDEGAFIVTLLTVGAAVYTSFAIFVVLNSKHRGGAWELPLTLAGAPLSWFALQMVMAFRYAHLYYRGNEAPGYVAPIDFPSCDEPGPWDFVYVAMIVGMTAQVADTNVQTTPMRRAVTLHAVVSFFFNTVLIAMAVNAAVTLAS